MRLPVATKAAKGRAAQLTPEMLVNMYAEQAPSGARAEVVAMGCPGLVVFGTVNDDKIRGVHKTLSDGNVYSVIGTALYRLNSDGTSSNLGTVGGSGRVDMADNGVEVCIVAGPKGYIYDSQNGLAQITDDDFPGAVSVTFIDGYFVFNNRQSGQKDQFFISDLRDGTTYHAADFATAERYPDNLVRVFADHSELLLFGTDSLEIWFNAGNADFPFSRAQGSVIEQGLGAMWSVQKLDESVIWLDNEGMVRRLEGTTPVRISTHAIEYQISRGDWTNAYSFAYVQEGHQFYVLTIPGSRTQQKGTYVYDAATQLWHQRKSYELDFWRAAFYVNAFGKHIVGDYDTATFYEMSLDFCQEGDNPLIAEIQFPQVRNDGERFIVHKFELDMEVGGDLHLIEVEGGGGEPSVHALLLEQYGHEGRSGGLFHPTAFFVNTIGYDDVTIGALAPDTYLGEECIGLFYDQLDNYWFEYDGVFLVIFASNDLPADFFTSVTINETVLLAADAFHENGDDSSFDCTVWSWPEVNPYDGLSFPTSDVEVIFQ